MKASSRGHLPVGEALLQAKADVNEYDVSIFSISVCVNHSSACAEAAVLFRLGVQASISALD